eukprot:CAMPEP_0114165182 /NCGR_PEP_ID=MMETSP0043_2-20121206/31102_1 /TAXON_ID=464988 /ORGANISM="Hemiselmis andersenii, Strain CCMP644" /LENGTH=56 /DNA_ID=CAMNT_0001261967 /DNA_START=1 /DNA_END=168 /DNA_ORIENTATION=-
MCPAALMQRSSLRTATESTNETPPLTTSSVKSATLHASGVFSGVLALSPAPSTSAT